MTEQHLQEPGGVVPIPTTRRALVRAGAWSAPAVMVAATAPAAAAASPPPAYLSVSGAIGALQARPNFQWTWSFTLDSITVETAPGTDRNSVRLVKRGETSVSIGCS